METLPIFQVDAFAHRLFSGNPAAVVLLTASKNYDDALLQSIAEENNLSETAFIYVDNEKIKNEEPIRLRWFTPKAEVNLCGHASLASAFVYFSELQPERSKVVFDTRSGNLTCLKVNDKISIDLPKDEISKIELTEAHKLLTTITPIEVYHGKEDLMLVFSNEVEVQKAEPNFSLIEKINHRGLIITAKGEKVDVVSRFFTPQLGINEDPVTGSAHTTLAIYWGDKLNKTKLSCKQLSLRGGRIECEVKTNKVQLLGEAKCFLKGEIYTP